MIVTKEDKFVLAFHLAPFLNTHTFDVDVDNHACLLSTDFITNALPKFTYINKNIFYFDDTNQIWRFKRPVIAHIGFLASVKSGRPSNIISPSSSNSRIISPYLSANINSSSYTTVNFNLVSVFENDEFPSFYLNDVPDTLIIEKNDKFFDYYCYVKPLNFEQEYFYINKN